MDAQTWNREYPIGTRVSVRKFNGDIVWTRTVSQAARWGGMDHVAVEAIQPGYVLLSWCSPLEPPVQLRDGDGQHAAD